MSDINTIKENARTFEGLIPPNSAKLVYKEKKAGIEDALNSVKEKL